MSDDVLAERVANALIEDATPHAGLSALVPGIDPVLDGFKKIRCWRAGVFADEVRAAAGSLGR